LSGQVSAISREAENLERAGKYEEAARQWEQLRSIYSPYPGVDTAVERLRNLAAQARSAAREASLVELRAALNTANYENARTLLQKGKQDFPGDREFVSIERRIEEGVSRRAKGQKLLVEGEKAFGKQKWQKGGKAFTEACEVAPSDPVIV